MENLNSILIEGILVDNPELTEEKKKFCLFTIASKSECEKHKAETIIDIVAYGEMAVSCQRIGREGRGVRVVGKLKQRNKQSNDPTPPHYIEAEHVEFKPEFKAKGQ
jgi:single-strand DNA-binding protein